jgi:hypothetical protein
MARIALQLGQTEEANNLVLEAAAFAEERSMRHLYPPLALAMAQVRLASSEPDSALEHLGRAVSLGQVMNLRPLVIQACIAAAKILDQMGRPAEALEKRARARGLVEEIAGLFTDADLRTVYLEHASDMLE